MDLVRRAIDTRGICFLGIVAETGESLNAGPPDTLRIAYFAWHVQCPFRHAELRYAYQRVRSADAPKGQIITSETLSSLTHCPSGDCQTADPCGEEHGGNVKDLLSETNSSAPRLSLTEAFEKMRSGDVLMMDVRDPTEVQQKAKMKL